MSRTTHQHEPQQQQGPSEHTHFAGQATHIADIRRAVTTKHNKIFMLTTENGDIIPNGQGLGIYFRDTCFLDQMEMKLNGQWAIGLLADASRGKECIFELTNPELELAGGASIVKERLSIRRDYQIGENVVQTIAITNLDHLTAKFALTLDCNSHFINMFEVRGAAPGKRGVLHPPQTRGDCLTLRYDGADMHERVTTMTFSPTPQRFTGGTAQYDVTLKPHQHLQIQITINLDDQGPDTVMQGPATTKHTQQTDARKHQELHEILTDLPAITTDNPLFDRALQRAFMDLRMLSTVEHGDTFLAAGVPWYVALFGRDSCISAFQMLAYQPVLARNTLEILASYQGTKDSSFQDEEPGKILHELRVGEQANLHEAPQYPYYGSVDATPWFLMLMGEYIRWTDDITIFDQLQDNVERALQWIDNNIKQTGFLIYGTKSEKGLTNQGWKDSGNSIVNSDGTEAAPPIALVEVQGYYYAAKRAMAAIFRRKGDTQRAEQLERDAASMQQRFNQTFWLVKQQFYALAIQQDGKLAEAIASNAGQTLFTGIPDPDKIAPIAQRLLADDMFTGWGVRTLSAKEAAYNPLDYQVGSVWPHDNSLIALGLHRTGHVEEAERIFTGMFQAATLCPHLRLPEVFDGFDNQQYDRPVRYPVACSPQAWAAGAIPLLLQTALGLEPDAPNRTLHIRCPNLPAWLHHVTVEGLRVGDAKVNLRYQRVNDITLAAVTQCNGEVAVNVEY